MTLNHKESTDFIGKTVKIIIDRPMGSRHPAYNYIYPINYGYLPNTMSGDGEELDAYVLGVDVPLKEFTGIVIAVIKRLSEDDDKLVAAPPDIKLSRQQIAALTYFQEQHFQIKILINEAA